MSAGFGGALSRPRVLHPEGGAAGESFVEEPGSVGGTHDVVPWLAKRGRWPPCSAGMEITGTVHRHLLEIPASA
ncbi:hypothetical protein [Streptomyces sp. NPDC057052]|uniref:hypothetical protein n=1 Tax=Streptomyces sp. NPDC057052 TaxID=3346010 RepID=UPI00362F7CDB